MDFLITPSGDLAFMEEDNSLNKLCVTFYKSSIHPLRITFGVEVCEPKEAGENALTVMFNVEEIKNNKRVPIASDKVFTTQQILMRLKTSLGELANRTTIGSTIEKIMHKDISDSKVQESFKKIVSSAIEDLLTEHTIKVRPVVKKDNGYKQCMEIYIYEGNTLLTSQEMEW